jgi:SAM-dependent methyltransferase
MSTHHDHDHDHGHAPDMPVMDEAFWDERYDSSPALWSGQPNPQLVAEAADLVPGAALDVGCGEGADAIWLAERGWRVTAVDWSAVALQRGADHAQQAGAEVAQRISWLHADLIDWVPAQAAYDLVSAQFMHLGPDQRDALYRRLAAAVAPGGTLLVVGHHPSDLQTTARRPPFPQLLFTAADIASLLNPGEWATVVEEARPRRAPDSDGQPITVHDAVLRAQRAN